MESCLTLTGAESANARTAAHRHVGEPRHKCGLAQVGVQRAQRLAVPLGHRGVQVRAKAQRELRAAQGRSQSMWRQGPPGSARSTKSSNKIARSFAQRAAPHARTWHRTQPK